MTDKKMCNILLIVQIILFLFATTVGILALFDGELFPFFGCMFADVIVFFNVRMIDRMIPRKRIRGLNAERK